MRTKPLALSLIALWLLSHGAFGGLQQARLEAPTQPSAGVHVPGDDRLLELAEAARLLVTGHYGENVKALDTEVAIVSRHQLKIGLIRDLKPQCEVQTAARHVNALTVQLAETYSRAMLARYASCDGRIQICPENIEQLGVVLNRPSMVAEETLTAVLIHEFVHARDARDHGLSELLGGATSTDELQACSAVIEGHAQWVTRRIVDDIPDEPGSLKRGFKAFTEAITLVPEGIEDPTAKLQAEVAAQGSGFTYVEGERFVEAVLHARGPGAIGELFKSPPSDPLVILRPDWYLHPETRPESTVEIDQALDHFQESAMPETFRAVRQTLTEGALQASFAGVDSAIVDQFVGSLVRAKVIQCTSPDDPNKYQILGVLEFSSSADALVALSAQGALMEFRDRQHRDGAVRITAAEYKPWTHGNGARGVTAIKTIKIGWRSFQAVTVLVVRGPVMVELTLAGSVGDVAQARVWAEEALAAAYGEAVPAVQGEPEGAPGEGK